MYKDSERFRGRCSDSQFDDSKERRNLNERKPGAVLTLNYILNIYYFVNQQERLERSASVRRRKGASGCDISYQLNSKAEGTWFHSSVSGLNNYFVLLVTLTKSVSCLMLYQTAHHPLTSLLQAQQSHTALCRAAQAHQSEQWITKLLHLPRDGSIFTQLLIKIKILSQNEGISLVQ